jgi:hypothetical protein
MDLDEEQQHCRPLPSFNHAYFAKPLRLSARKYIRFSVVEYRLDGDEVKLDKGATNPLGGACSRPRGRETYV